MSRKTRVRLVFWSLILSAVISISFGVWWIARPGIIDGVILELNPEAVIPPLFSILQKIPGYIMLGIGIVCIALIPLVVKLANKRADVLDAEEREKAEMREMLRDYRQRRTRP